MICRISGILLAVCGALWGQSAAVQYSDALGRLDTTDPASACRARSLLRESMPKAPMAERAAMFRAMLGFYEQVGIYSGKRFDQAFGVVLDRALQQIGPYPAWTVASPAPGGDSEIRRAVEPWIKCGYLVRYAGEGSFGVVTDVSVAAEFSRLLPSDLRAWVELAGRDDALADGILHDATLMISWDALATRLRRWESLLRMHPSLEPEMGYGISRMAGVLFTGVDNSRIAENGVIEPEVLAAWRRYASDPAPSKYLPTARKLIRMAEANKGRMTPEMESAGDWIREEWFGHRP